MHGPLSWPQSRQRVSIYEFIICTQRWKRAVSAGLGALPHKDVPSCSPVLPLRNFRAPRHVLVLRLIPSWNMAELSSADRGELRRCEVTGRCWADMAGTWAGVYLTAATDAQAALCLSGCDELGAALYPFIISLLFDTFIVSDTVAFLGVSCSWLMPSPSLFVFL